MTLIFSHVWAIWWWRNTYVQAKADSLRSSECDLGIVPTSVEELEQSRANEVRLELISRNFPHNLPMELITNDSAQHARMTHIKVRCWNGFVPFGAICKAGQHHVSSPEFCFVQIASDIRRICQERLERWQYVVVLVELGCELCGTYSKRESSRGFVNRDVPLVGTWHMRSFASYVAYSRGASLAYEALRWVIDGLNSPMETVVYLMLCLPRTWGGMGLPKPRSNWSILVPSDLQNKTPKQCVIPDLYWPEFGLAVEFFGEDFHLGREHEDSDRQEIEQDMGLKVVTFWKDDVLNLRRFNAKAASVAHYLGQQLPEASKEFEKLQSTLQGMLVKRQRWI